MKLTAAQKDTLEIVFSGGVERATDHGSPTYFVEGHSFREVVVERLLDLDLVSYSGLGSKVRLTDLGRNALAAERAAKGGG